MFPLSIRNGVVAGRVCFRACQCVSICHLDTRGHCTGSNDQNTLQFCLALLVYGHVEFPSIQLKSPSMSKEGERGSVGNEDMEHIKWQIIFFVKPALSVAVVDIHVRAQWQCNTMPE